MKLGIGSVFLPLFGLASSSQHAPARRPTRLCPRGELVRQNESLRRENQQLRIATQETGDAARENDRLRAALRLAAASGRKLKLANVVLRETRQLVAHRANRPRQPRRRPDESARADHRRIRWAASVRSSTTRSQVVLLGDPNCKVAARVENESRDTGVIGACGAAGPRPGRTKRLSRNGKSQARAEGASRAVEGAFSRRDFPIGKVVDSHLVEYGLYTMARVRLAANLGALEEVWVLMPMKPLYYPNN